jgi:hypothetical protein
MMVVKLKPFDRQRLLADLPKYRSIFSSRPAYLPPPFQPFSLAALITTPIGRVPLRGVNPEARMP